MGWLFMQSLKGHATPKAYIDAQFTHEHPQGRSRVLRSALVRFRTYYAAVEHLPLDGDREVWALICLVRYNPRDKEGYIFGYKDMSETMGPLEADCPAAILDLLSPTGNAYAQAWRRQCRERLARAKKPLPRDGQMVTFDTALHFSDGLSFTRLQAVRPKAFPRRVWFQSDSGGLYRIPNLKTLAFTVEDSPVTDRAG